MRKFLVILGLFAGLLLVVAGVSVVRWKTGGVNDDRKFLDKLADKYPQCPENLEGILTYPFLDPKYLSAITPLGNINPPGHTSPVDHNYFSTNYEGKIPMYAPADSWITNIATILAKEPGGTYKTKWYNLRFTLCNGLELYFANYNDIIQPLKDEIAKQRDDCKLGIEKPGHDFVEGQCHYQVTYKVKAGELLGWIYNEKRSDGRGSSLGFEIWAANYNKPARSDVNWDYYNDDRYAHIMCTFDLYTGDLKKQFYAKFGRWDMVKSKDPDSGKVELTGTGRFLPRTVPPLCGQVNQDIVGTIQGMWFGEKPAKNETVEFAGKGLAFLHDNVDPTLGEISVGGDLNKNQSLVIFFKPVHSGTIDREPSEVKNDGQVYCYNSDREIRQKFLVQLVDDHNLKAEIFPGECTAKESFTNPFTYER